MLEELEELVRPLVKELEGLEELEELEGLEELDTLEGLEPLEELEELEQLARPLVKELQGLDERPGWAGDAGGASTAASQQAMILQGRWHRTASAWRIQRTAATTCSVRRPHRQPST